MKKLAVSLLVAGLAVLLAPFVPTAAATTPAARSWLRLTLSTMQPSVVTSSDTSVSFTGTITNISDRNISGLKIRVELGDALTSGTEVRTALSPNSPYSHGKTLFQSMMTGGLAPGKSVQFQVLAPLQGSYSLNVDRPGVYPLLVNVNGTPDYGGQALLSAATLLLPVLAAPGGQQPPATSAGHLSVLWPLVDDQPRVVGMQGNQIVLSDDSLATSLGSGGRLFGLLDAVEQAHDDSTLLDSLCFAVDPDLLDTVTQMANGYLVRSGSGTVAGQGAAAANLWLHTLKSLTTGRCVLVLPYADADLAALAHAGGTSLLQLALSESTTVADSLGASRLTNVAWPADDSLDTTTMADLAGLGVNTVLLAPTSVTPTAGTSPVSLAGFTGGAAPKVVPIDPVVTDAMAPRGDQPNIDETALSAQDGLAATIYQTVFAGDGRSVLVAPPRRWSPTESQAEQFLSATSAVLSGHYAQPTSLATATSTPAAGPPVALNYLPNESIAEVAHQVAAKAVSSDAQVRDVQNAMARDHTAPDPVLPAQLVTPLRLSLLRAVSSAWRGGGTTGADAMLGDADAEFESLTGAVSVIQPNLPILLGSSSSRLPVTVRNRLSVDVAIRVDIAGEPGLPEASTEDLIPAGGSVTVFIPTTVTRSGRFSVYATVRTLGGTQLGEQARIELVSSAYGVIVVIVTALAFGLLVLLSGRRIYRRVKAARAAQVVTQPGEQAVEALVGAPERAERREPDRP